MASRVEGWMFERTCSTHMFSCFLWWGCGGNQNHGRLGFRLDTAPLNNSWRITILWLYIALKS